MRAKLLDGRRKLKRIKQKNLMLGAFREQLEKERWARESDRTFGRQSAEARESDRTFGRQPAEALESDRTFGRQPAEALESDRTFGRQPAEACKEANASAPKRVSMKIEY
jgi:hypothetical protein